MKKINNILVLLILFGCSHQEIKPDLLSGVPQAPSSIPKTIDDIDTSQIGAVNFGTWKLLFNTDTEALDSAIKSKKSIFFPDSTYIINERISFNARYSYYLGETETGVIIKYDIPKDNDMWDNYLGVVTAHDVKFENITFSGNNLDVNVALLEIGSPDTDETYKTSNTQFINCTVKNVKGSDITETIAGSNQIYGIRVWLNKARNFIFDNVTFENISAHGDDSLTAAGFTGGLLLWSNIAAEDINEPIHGNILNCSFKNIYTEDIVSDINLSDADGIRLHIPNSTSQNIDPLHGFDLNIKDNVFEGVEKSAIKISAGQGIHIENTTVKSTGPNGIADMLAAIRIQPAIDVTITNTIVEGSFKFILNLRGQNIYVDGIQKGESDYEVNSTYDGGSAIVQIQKNDAIQNKDITIQNIEDGNVRKILKLRDNGNLLDTDITLRNVNLNQNMTYTSNLGGGQARIEVREAENVLLDNVEVLDWGTGTKCVTIIDSKNITILDSHLYAKEIGIETRFTNDAGVIDSLTIDGTVFKRGDHSNSTLRFAYFRPLKIGSQVWGEIGKLKLTNSSFHAYGFDTKSNQESTLIGAEEVEINNVQFYFTPASGQFLPDAGVKIVGANEIYIQNVSLDANSYTNDIYSVMTVDSSDPDASFDIDNITSSVNGVWLKNSPDIEVDTTSINCPGIKLTDN